MSTSTETAAEFVTIERSQLEALIRRVANEEIARFASRQVAIAPELEVAVVRMTNELFGVATAQMEIRSGAAGEDDFVVVTVAVGTEASPKVMAANHTVWHDKLVALGVPLELDLRLKVAYK